MLADVQCGQGEEEEEEDGSEGPRGRREGVVMEWEELCRHRGYEERRGGSGSRLRREPTNDVEFIARKQNKRKLFDYV